MMFEDSEEFDEGGRDFDYNGQNLFGFSEDQRNSFNKRLPKGFCFVRKSQLPRFQQIKPQKPIQIQYVPVKKQKRIASKQLQNSLNLINPVQIQQSRKGMVLTLEGKSRQMEKIKNIIQKFRKHPKYTTLYNNLSRIGLHEGLNSIETENKKNLLTIQTFKDRYMLILQTAKRIITQNPIIQLIDDMIEEFLMYVEQARKAQFENNIQSIQKSVDKITRHMSQVKTQGNWYVKKKKKGDKAYTEPQILHLSDLIQSLPVAYLVGIWQIIQEKPFPECSTERLTFNLAELGNKRLKQIENYTKNKLLILNRSRRRKREKIMIKKGQVQSERQEYEDQGEQQAQLQEQIQEQNKSVLGEHLRSKPYQQLQELFLNNPLIDQPLPLKLQEPQKVIQLKVEKEEQSDEDSMDMNNSSDSSMITDQEESQF